MGRGSLVGGVSIQSTRSGRYMTACHIAKVEVWSLLVQTVTSSMGPKHFQMSANSITGAASMCSSWRGEAGSGEEEGGEPSSTL